MSSNELRSRRSRYSDHQYQNSSIYNGSVKSSLNNFSVDLPHNRKKVNTIEKQIISKQNLTYKTIINLTNTKYAILQEVSGPQNLNWKVQTFGQTKHWTIKWCDTGMTNQILQRMHYLQKINHFPSTNVITRKNNLAMTLTKMKQQFPNQYNFYPRTFLYPKESSKVLHYYVESRKKGLLKTFIIKPQAGCQGRGIFLTQNYGQIQKQQQCIVQKYISNPLLYQGLKFDLRIYVLLSCCNPLRIYLYNQGLVRFATEKYSFPLPQNLNNLFVHLTNYAINKSNPDYQYNYSINDMAFGHKKSLAQFFKILKDLGYRANSYWSQIKDCIIKTLIAAQPFILSNYKTCRPNDATYNMCFQVFGFDFMIDNRDQCFLLEVNHTPSFTTDTPLDHIIKKNLIKDTLLMMNPSFEQIKLRQQLERSKQRDKYIKFKNSNQNLAFHRQQLIKQINKIRQSHQQAFKGTYELIYPSKNSNKQTNYERLLSASIRNSYSAGQSSKSAYSASNLRSMLFQSSNNQKIISKNSLAKINQHPQIANKKNIIYNYNYIKGNMTNKKGLSTLPVEIISNKKQKSKNDRFIRVNSSQKLKTQMTAKKQIREIKQPSNIRHSKFQYIPQQNSYKSEQKRNRLAVVQESRQRMKTNPSEERGKVNSEINSFTKRIRAYKTPLM